MTKPRQAAKIYREAARLLEIKANCSESGSPIGFSCAAVAQAAGVFHAWNWEHAEVPAVNEYRAMFPDNFGMDYNDEARDHRILALCMMAAMVERP